MNPLNQKLILKETNMIVGTGWLPPRPDLRDYTQHKKEIKEFNKKLGIENQR